MFLSSRDIGCELRFVMAVSLRQFIPKCNFIYFFQAMTISAACSVCAVFFLGHQFFNLAFFPILCSLVQLGMGPIEKVV